MMADARQAKYQATYRQRTAYRAQANLLGWSKLEILDAFVTDTGELIVIDKEGNRYGTEAHAIAPPDAPPAIVEPVSVDVHTFVERWQEARAKIGQSVAELDLTKLSHADALKLFTEMAALSLRGVEILRHYDGPDWREQLNIGG